MITPPVVPTVAVRADANTLGANSVVDGAVLVVDPWHWLTEDGHFIADNPRLYRRMLRIARFIEYGGELEKREMRETLMECTRRPRGKTCPGLMWVVKTQKDELLAHCMICRTEEVLVHNWQKTEWAEGMMKPVPVSPDEGVLN